MQIESPLTRFDAWNPSAIRIFRACKGLTVPLITGTGPSARSLCHRMGAETCIAHAARILDGASSRLLCAVNASRPSPMAASTSRRCARAPSSARCGCGRRNSARPALMKRGSRDHSRNCACACPAFMRTRYSGSTAPTTAGAYNAAGLAGGDEQGTTVQGLETRVRAGHPPRALE